MIKLTPAAFSKALAPIVAAVTNSPRANPRQLKPSQLLRLVNSTPLGAVLTDAKLRIHRQAAGDRIGEGKTIDFLRYVSWLALNRDRSSQVDRVITISFDDAYARKKKTERERQARKSREGRELGELPAVVDPERREACRTSLRLFLEQYFGKDFLLAWSPDHLKLIAEAERRILDGGLKAIAMPRGTGKTTICERVALWAILYGRIQYVVLIGANKDAALEMLDTFKAELETNDLLCEDFPEVCIPVREVASAPQRQKGQLYQGERTRIEWSGQKRIVLPSIPGSLAAGAVVQCSGILGRVRGMKFVDDRGTRRPQLCLIDDPQTDVSARSQSQITKRMRVMTGAILGLAGPGVKIAALAPVTVIRPGDMADQILDRDAHPEWDGLRTKLVYGEAKSKDLIDQYWDLRAEEMRSGDPSLPKTQAFYKTNQKKLEAGLTAAWPERFNADEISAIQHFLNLIQDRGKDIVDAEYQNDPQPETSGDDWHISAEDIAAKVNGLPRGIVPQWATKLTAFCDIQQRLLYWAAIAWGDKGRGAVIDYGAWPEQKAREFTYNEIRNTLSRQYPKRGIKGAIAAGLGDLTKAIVERDWKREDGTPVRVTAFGIDSGNWTADVHEFVRTSKHAGILYPTKGKGVTADKRPISEWKKKPAEQIGEEWILTPQPKHASRLLTFDSHWGKHQLFLQLSTPLGDPGDLSLFGSETVLTHRMIAAHCHAESFTKTESDRVVYVFAEKPGRPDNHLLDCLVGARFMQLNGLQKRVRRRAPRKATYL
jgi:hypothetical protein